MVRELHVYGSVVPVAARSYKNFNKVLFLVCSKS